MGLDPDSNYIAKEKEGLASIMPLPETIAPPPQNWLCKMHHVHLMISINKKTRLEWIDALYQLNESHQVLFITENWTVIDNNISIENEGRI